MPDIHVDLCLPPARDVLELGAEPDSLRVSLASVLQGRDGKDGGATVDRAAGADLSALKAVWEDTDGKVWPLDKDDAAHIGRFSGITRSASLAGGNVAIQRSGVLDAAGLDLAPGPVWLGANGALTQTPATTGFDLYLGAAVAGPRLILSPAEPIELE
ncbi:MAG: hypothetical protein LBF93_03550 [Zoogloeaceae bacterium]|jgi:hypothetical protein|nr:hypothetical protein [Zoogloeaceae bacterium]